MGKCILMGFGGAGYSKLFELWASVNMLSTQAVIPSRGTISLYQWCKNNFITAKTVIPAPTGYTFEMLKGWAKENFILTKVDV